MFDGVHIAHQRLIRTAVRLAKRRRGTSVVITFDPDPQCVLDPRHAQTPFMPLAARVRLIQALGVDLIWIIPFTRRFSRLSPKQFVDTILLERVRASCVVVGATFTFGSGRRGNLALLRRLGQQHGMRVVSLSPVLRGGQTVSSSRIRALIANGELDAAQRLLGRPVELYGTVVHGQGRARRLGFPTANVRLTSQLLPPRGVYHVWLMHAGRRVDGLMNLGVRPTFLPARMTKGQAGGLGPLVCEVHLVGFNGTLYGQPVIIGLLKRLRDEQRFDSPQELITQIRRDFIRARLLRRSS
jgi:riboflavin kinase/FMN adenylyltransferase